MSKEWSALFGPSYTPEEMLKLGVFEGKYINAVKGVPAAWKKIDKVLKPSDKPDAKINKYGIKSRSPLSEWKAKGYLMSDLSGWFEWYINYYLGRRLGKEDDTQINRWRSFVARHQGQIKANCTPKDETCRPKQRQGLLQWGWDSTNKYDDAAVSGNAKRMAKLTSSTISTEGITPDVKMPIW